MRSIVPSPPRLTASSRSSRPVNEVGGSPLRTSITSRPCRCHHFVAVVANRHAADCWGCTTRRMAGIPPSLRPRPRLATRKARRDCGPADNGGGTPATGPYGSARGTLGLPDSGSLRHRGPLGGGGLPRRRSLLGGDRLPDSGRLLGGGIFLAGAAFLAAAVFLAGAAFLAAAFLTGAAFLAEEVFPAAALLADVTLRTAVSLTGAAALVVRSTNCWRTLSTS